MRRGQVSVEYLAIFGLVLLAIVGAVSFISNTGFLNPCQATTPSFSGQPFSIEEARFTDTNEITVSLRATSANLNGVGLRLDTNGDGVGDHNGTDIISLDAGAGSQTLTLDTGSEFSGGECASNSLGINYSTDEITSETIAWGSTSFTRTVQ